MTRSVSTERFRENAPYECGGIFWCCKPAEGINHKGHEGTRRKLGFPSRSLVSFVVIAFNGMDIPPESEPARACRWERIPFRRVRDRPAAGAQSSAPDPSSALPIAPASQRFAESRTAP